MKKFNFSKGLIVGLLTFALCIVAFAAVGAKADEQAAAAPTKTAPVAAEYDAANDTVTAGSNAYVYVVKAATGNKIKSGQTATAQMANNKISIADLGIKGTNKDVFLYVCDKEVEVADGETVSANLTIKGNANKVVGAIDYTQADDLESVDVISAYYVDKATKKQVAIASEKLYWAAEAEGPFYLANDDTVGSGTTGRKIGNAYVTNGFNGKDLADMLEAGGTIYIKQAGTRGTSGTAQFGSKVAKVKIAKQAKAPKAKIDVAKDTIALKNGFDFALFAQNEQTKEYELATNWYTILPVLKTATFSDAIVGGTVGEGNAEKVTCYKPLGKKDANAGKEVKNDGDDNYYYSYTKKQVKALSIDEMFGYLQKEWDEEILPDNFKIAIRKSATEKKPASAYILIDLGLQAEAPIVYTKDNVDGQFLIASADEFSKKGLSLGDIKAFAGYTGTNTLTMETSGFDKTFDFKTATANTLGRDEGSVFEYAVVATADYAATGDNAIDWTTVKWKKFDPAKLKITEKLSGKYNTVKGAKKTAELKSTAAADISKGAGKTEKNNDSFNRTVVKDSVVKADTKALLLIRRQGDKASSKRASKYIALYVAKEDKKYNLYSTVSNGEPANLITIQFAKYKKAEGTQGQAGYKAAGFYIDESIAPVTKWTQKAQTGVALEALTDAEYWKAGLPNETTKICALTDPTAAANQYKPETSATEKGNATDAIAVGEYKLTELVTNSNTTLVFAIREYANIKVTGDAAIKGTPDTAVENSSRGLASVVKGKRAQYVNGSFTTGIGDVIAYVGSEVAIKVDGSKVDEKDVGSSYNAQKPTGYVLDNVNGVKAVDGQAYSNSTLTVTPESADEVEYTITYYVKVETFDVTFDTDGGSNVAKQTINYGGKVTKPTTDPTKDNCTFAGWFSDAEKTKSFDFDKTEIKEATTIYAKWTDAE